MSKAINAACPPPLHTPSDVCHNYSIAINFVRSLLLLFGVEFYLKSQARQKSILLLLLGIVSLCRPVLKQMQLATEILPPKASQCVTVCDTDVLNTYIPSEK